jgi:hypothetical protein
MNIWAKDDLVMTSPKQEQVVQHRDRSGVCAPLLVPADLMLAQARFQVLIHELNRPMLLANAHRLSQGQLWQIGRQNFGLFRAYVMPFCAQYHGNMRHHLHNTDMSTCYMSFLIFIEEDFCYVFYQYAPL